MLPWYTLEVVTFNLHPRADSLRSPIRWMSSRLRPNASEITRSARYMDTSSFGPAATTRSPTDPLTGRPPVESGSELDDRDDESTDTETRPDYPTGLLGEPSLHLGAQVCDLSSDRCRHCS